MVVGRQSANEILIIDFLNFADVLGRPRERIGRVAAGEIDYAPGACRDSRPKRIGRESAGEMNYVPGACRDSRQKRIGREAAGEIDYAPGDC